MNSTILQTFWNVSNRFETFRQYNYVQALLSGFGKFCLCKLGGSNAMVKFTLIFSCSIIFHLRELSEVGTNFILLVWICSSRQRLWFSTVSVWSLNKVQFQVTIFTLSQLGLRHSNVFSNGTSSLPKTFLKWSFVTPLFSQMVFRHTFFSLFIS